MAQDDTSHDHAPGPGIREAARNLVTNFERALLFALHTGELCRVVAFHPPQPAGPGGQPPRPAEVDVQLLQRRQRAEPGVDGREVRMTDSLPVYPNVPMFWPGLPPNMAVMPAVDGEGLVGTMGYLCGMTRDREPYCLHGVEALPYQPEELHSLNNAFFVPGVVSGADAPQIPALESGVTKLGDFAGTWALALEIATKIVKLLTTGPTLELDAVAEVKVGAAAVAPIARADVADANAAALLAAVSAAVPVPGDGGAALQAAIIAGLNAGSSTAATKGRVE